MLVSWINGYWVAWVSAAACVATVVMHNERHTVLAAGASINEA